MSSTIDRAREMAAAIQEIKEGHKEKAASRLLDLWRARRSTALAVVLEHLAPVTITIERNLAAMEAQLTQNLRPRLPDPCVARAVLSFLRAMPFTSRRSRDMWLVIFDLLEKAGDPRIPSELAEISKADLQVADSMRDWLIAWMQNTLRDLPKEPPPDEPDETKALVQELALLVVPQKSEITKAKEKTAHENRAGLFAAVYASPDDDGPREVLADHLLEVNDPLGEFITLQLKNQDAPEPSEREEALLKKHRKTWLGELARFTHTKTIGFRRGFPSEAALKIASAREAEWAANIPAWATLEKVRVGWASHEIPKTLHAVREISDVRDETIAMIVAHPHIRPVAIRCAHPLGDLDTWRKLEASPASERLKIVENVPLRFLADSLRARLEEIHVPLLHAITQEMTDLLIDHAPRLRVFLRSSIGRFELYATPSSKTIHVVVHPNPQINDWQLRGYAFDHFAKITSHIRTEGSPKNKTGAQLLLTKLEESIVSWGALRDWDFESIGGSKGSRTAKLKPTTPATTTSHPRARAPHAELHARAQTLFASATQPSLLAWTSRDGGTLVAVERGGLCAIDAATGNVRAVHPTSDVIYPAQVTEDGRMVLLQHARSALFCDPIDGKRLHDDIASTLTNPSSIRAMNANGRFVVTTESIIDLETKAVTTVPSQKWFTDYHANGKRWLTALAYHELLPVDEAAAVKTKPSKKKTTKAKKPIGPPQRMVFLPTLEGSTGIRFARFLDPHDEDSREIVMIVNAQYVDNAPSYRIARVDLRDDTPAILYSVSQRGVSNDVAISSEVIAVAQNGGVTLFDPDSAAIRAELLRGESGPTMKVAFDKDATRLFFKTRDRLGAYDLEDDREIWSFSFR